VSQGGLAMEQEQSARVERRLAAIVAADVAGYSRLMGLDEIGTARTLREHRKVTDALVVKHGGRLVKTTGDGVLLEFSSVVDAVECAVAVQAVMAERNEVVPGDRRMLFRIGINLGDILIEGDDILGDGVNLAARLEGIAEPGGICISSSAYDQVRGKVAVEFVDLGEQNLKNIARPVRAYAVMDNVPGITTHHPYGKVSLPLPDRPSIAVLPFQNMSGDPEQEYFADGMVEDIITALSRFKLLFVIARNSSFTYKGKTVDIRQVGRELGVRYVLEGSVRKAGSKVRITGQLIDAATGVHLWADHFDGGLEDVFDLQDQITANVVGAIAPRLQQLEIERSKHKPTESLDAYDYYLRGIALYAEFARATTDEALRLLSRAIELDPDFAPAYAAAARCYSIRKSFGWMVDPAQETADANRLARIAVKLGADDAFVLGASGFAIAYVVGDAEAGAAYIDRALSLNPDLAPVCGVAGWVSIRLGKPDIGIAQVARAMRLSPLDPSLVHWQTWTAAAHFFAGRDEDAISWAKAILIEHPDNPHALGVLAASLALLERTEEAQKVVAQIRQVYPMSRASIIVASGMQLQRPQDRDRFAEGMRLAGLPELAAIISGSSPK
jgi:TolB-like protein/class 3 adenylate cyclase/tetratricopeptide (TPR) repeat protein